MRFIGLKLKSSIYNSKLCFDITKTELENNDDFGVICLEKLRSKEDTTIFKSN